MGDEFDDDLDEALLYERDELETGWAVLSKRWNISSEELKIRYRFLINREAELDRNRHAGERRCLRCRKNFWSEHKKNVQICAACTVKNQEFASNMADDNGFGS